MSRRNKIIYWTSTIWLSLGMLSTGIVQLLQKKEETAFILDLGYPAYFLVLLGAWKIMGVLAILTPKFPRLQELAYAGFFFTMTGALFSHIATGGSLKDLSPALLLLVLTLVSWFFKPTRATTPLTSKPAENFRLVRE